MAHAQLVRNFRRASLALAIAAGPATAAALADQLPPPAAAGPCQQALERAGVEATEARLRALQSCAGASFRCVQEQPGSAACLARAHELCARELARAFDLAGQTAPACDALALADLLGDQGLGHAQLSCAPHGFTAVGSFADLAACVRDEQDCRAAEMLSIEFPRAWELLDLAGVAPSTIGCLDEGADGDGRGLAATARSGRLKKKDRVRTTAANGCQQAIASAGTTFARDYQKLLAGCLASAWTCLETGAGECWEAARQACAARFAARPEPGAALAARVGQVCGASAKKKQRVALPDLLDPSGLGFGALAERCARAGVPQLASVEDVGRCVELEHECATQRIVARQVPRAAELLAGAGLDPQQFPCLGAEISFVCGNTLAEEGEECDPPGSVGACGGGSLCNSLCECVDSRPPQLVVHPLVYTVPEGQPLSIGVAASDPDGERVVLTAAPALAGASFSATPGMAATGQFEFPPQSAPGLFLVTFTARDERGVTDQATVLIQVTNVNSAPEISVAPEALVDEGSVITIPVESGDPDGDLLTYTAAPLPPNATFVPATGTLSFAPDYEQAGIYDVTFQASDGTLLSNTATVRITVRDVAPGEPGETTGLILEVDRTPAVTLLQAQRVTGRVNPTTDTPEPERSTSSLVTGLSPAAAEQGLTLEVALTGHTTGELATHFVGGVSQASFGAGVTVVALDVRGPADAVASISIDPGAAIGPRQVMVVTRDETALSVLAFNVVAGHAAIHGTVVDADTGEPLAAAAIAVQGSTAGASTGTDGEFLVDPAPPGQLIVLVNAPDHELLSLPCEAVVGQVAELGEIAVRTTVYDPGRPASVSVHSLLGRAVNDLTGGLTFEQAREAIRDALILVGGTEAGVLDEYGNQLNPKVEGAGLSSLQDRGVQFYAEKIAAGETIGLLELLYQLSFGFSWSGGAPPKVNQWLAALQEIVDDAWASPNDPASAMPILLFNQGPRLNPNPPQISGSTRVNKFQAYLAVDSFLAAFAKSHPAGGLARAPLASKTADDDAPVYTTTWEDLLAAFGVAPTAPELPVSGGDVLPDLTMLIQQYYLDNSAEALAEVKEQLLELFPTLGLEQIFKENPYGVKEALDEVIRIAAEDISVHDVLQDFLTPDASHPDLTQLLQVNKGMCDMELYWGPEYFLKDLSINIVQSSWAPGAPYIWSVQETTTDLGGGIVIPAVEVVFYKSGDDYGDSASETYTYRLWRVDTDADSTLDRDADGTADRGTTSKLTLVGSGQVGDIEKMAPQVYRSDARKRVFKAFLPPAGMNRYRIDVVRLRGDGATLSAFDPSSAAYKNKLKPWLAGYVDDPAVIDPLGRIGRQQVHPGQGFLNATTSFTISPLSNAVSVWVGGQGSGLSRFGRVDLAADYKDKSKIYLSIPGWDENTEDRASGMIFRYDATNESLEKWTDPGFMLPGQIGLAIDENFNLYADNAASDTAYGGRIFRYVGYRRPDEDAFAPAYAAGTEKSKQHVGSVNYYSRDIQRAQPAMVQQVVVGPAANYGQDLFIADSDKNRITRLPVHLVEQVANVDTWHVTSQDWAWNSHTPPDGVPPIAFSWQSDLCFSRDLTKLFITQGSNVTWTSGGVDSGRAVTTGGAMFQNATGCAVCEAQGEQYLFVSDGLAGRIYRIPLAELPLDVPEDDAERKLFADRYAFIDSIDRPGQLRVTDDGGALVWADAVGLRYQRFGFSGQALDAQNNPLVGAVVTVDTASGPRSTTSDADGNYNFLDFPAQPFAYATITHPDYSTTERLALVGRCNANTRPVPCVLITSPGDGGPTGDGSVTVRGTIFPNAIDYAATASFLEVNDGSGTRTLPLVFTGHANDFVVEDVPLAIGDTVLYARVPAAGTMDAGSSIGTHVRRVSGVPETQAVAGVVLDERGDPRADVTVAISVNGVEVARAVSNACGYYNKDGLPPGAVTVEVLDGTEGRR